MATTTTQEVTTQPIPETAPKALPVNLTPNAIAKVKEIMAGQTPAPSGLRVGVVGGGCSGLTYKMEIDQARDGDKVFVAVSTSEGTAVFGSGTLSGATSPLGPVGLNAAAHATSTWGTMIQPGSEAWDAVGGNDTDLIDTVTRCVL
jgi:hypothetical protein